MHLITQRALSTPSLREQVLALLLRTIRRLQAHEHQLTSVRLRFCVALH